jgi:hypothetical protein
LSLPGIIVSTSKRNRNINRLQENEKMKENKSLEAQEMSLIYPKPPSNTLLVVPMVASSILPVVPWCCSWWLSWWCCLALMMVVSSVAAIVVLVLVAGWGSSVLG